MYCAAPELFTEKSQWIMKVYKVIQMEGLRFLGIRPFSVYRVFLNIWSNYGCHLCANRQRRRFDSIRKWNYGKA